MWTKPIPHALFRTAIAGFAITLIALLADPAPRAATAASGVFVGDATVTERDTDFNAQVPLTWQLPGPSIAIVRITVTPNAPANAGDIFPLTQTRTVSGTGSSVINIRVFGDLDREATQTATVSMTYDGILDGSDTGRLTVLDDDHPTVSISDATSPETSDAVHTLTLSKAINQPTQLRVLSGGVTATEGSDFGAVDRIINFAAGDRTEDVTVDLANDGTIEFAATETCSLEVLVLTAGDITIPGSDRLAVGTIQDNLGGNTPARAKFQFASDGSPFTCVDDMPTVEAFINPLTLTIRLELDHAMTMPFIFNLQVGAADGNTPAATAGSDFIPLNTFRTFPANQTVFTFTVTILDDSVTEGDEFIGLWANGAILSPASGCNQNLPGANNQVKILLNVA
jgi:hypothetical protein